MIEWLASDSRAAQVAAWAFLITVLGFAATLIGLWYTFAQARSAAEAADRASEAVESFKVRLRREAASRDVASAVRSLLDAVVALEAGKLAEAREIYEILRRSVIKLNTNDTISENQSSFLDSLHDHIISFSDSVAINGAGKGPKPDQFKAVRYLKECHLEFAKIDADLMREM